MNRTIILANCLMRNGNMNVPRLSTRSWIQLPLKSVERLIDSKRLLKQQTIKFQLKRKGRKYYTFHTTFIPLSTMLNYSVSPIAIIILNDVLTLKELEAVKFLFLVINHPGPIGPP